MTTDYHNVSTVSTVSTADKATPNLTKHKKSLVVKISSFEIRQLQANKNRLCYHNPKSSCKI